MVTYNPKDWLKLIFHFHKSDTLRMLFSPILLLGGITTGTVYVIHNFFPNSLPNYLTIFHQISGFIISLVLVFRINSAYDRWWEGRKLWGSLLNNSRNIAIKFNAILPKDDTVSRKEIQNLISNYAISLKEHLRGKNSVSGLEFNNSFTKEEFSKINHKPNYIANLLTLRSVEKCKQVDSDYLILNNNISELTDICGACERIKNTPIPFSYSIFIKKIVFIYVITMPISFGVSMGYWSIPTVMVMFYAFASLELISEEIEDPFGNDDNDLPTDEIAEKIKINTSEILLS